MNNAGKIIPISDYIQCIKCLVDNIAHPEIQIDQSGVCDICYIVEKKLMRIENLRKNNYLEKTLKKIKQRGKRKGYNCIVGISGGMDSSYLSVKTKEWGLTPLLVHVDTGWNSEIAVTNIETILNKLNLQLYTKVIPWEETKDLVNAFLKASVVDIDWANEMAAQASLYSIAKKFNQKYILTGHQISTEGWMPHTVVHYKLDLINFKAIHKLFGKLKLKSYPTIGFFNSYYYDKILGIKFINPLDYIEYNKQEIKNLLIRDYNWREYGHKHYENVFTRFYQGYILPRKFNIDKRKFHLSALILSGQITKAEALNIISLDSYNDKPLLEMDKTFVLKKLGLNEEEFEKIMKTPVKNHTDYPSVFNIIKKIKNVWSNN